MIYIPRIFSSYVSNVTLLTQFSTMNVLNYWSLIDLLEELVRECE